MLIRMSDNEVLASARLVRQDDGAVFLGYLKRALDEGKDRLVTADAETIIRRFQGRADALRDLIEALEIAPDLAVKLHDRARGR